MSKFVLVAREGYILSDEPCFPTRKEGKQYVKDTDWKEDFLDEVGPIEVMEKDKIVRMRVTYEEINSKGKVTRLFFTDTTALEGEPEEFYWQVVIGLEHGQVKGTAGFDLRDM